MVPSSRFDIARLVSIEDTIAIFWESLGFPNLANSFFLNFQTIEMSSLYIMVSLKPPTGVKNYKFLMEI